MTFDSFEVIFYTLAFVVPGFIFSSVFSILVPVRPDKEYAIIRFLLFSSVNYAVCSGLIFYITRPGYAGAHPLFAAASWMGIVFVSPIILGTIVGAISQREKIRKALQFLGLNPVHIIPTGWDFRFSRITEGKWVLVTLKDGSKVAGWFGSNSFASSDAQDRDIYIEEVYRINETGPWSSIPNNEGVLLRGEQISFIEFWRN